MKTLSGISDAALIVLAIVALILALWSLVLAIVVAFPAVAAPVMPAVCVAGGTLRALGSWLAGRPEREAERRGLPA